MNGGRHLLSLREFSVVYRSDVALDNISLGIPAGERLAIIGESGSGKSTLALAIAGLLPDSAQVGGRIEWSGPRPLPGRDIGFVFQDPAASLDPVMSVGRQVAEVARAHLGLDWAAAHERASALFERVRLPDPAAMLGAFPHQLSGGQKQRVAIAAAIAAGPKLLIADEATSALDTIVQAEIVTLINELVTADGMTLVFISHDIALAASIADRIAVFRAGRLIEIGPTGDVVNRPRHPYTRALLDAHIGLDTPPLLRSGASNG
jgi:peptide/nickel transport system ATP-binding protein